MEVSTDWPGRGASSVSRSYSAWQRRYVSCCKGYSGYKETNLSYGEQVINPQPKLPPRLHPIKALRALDNPPTILLQTLLAPRPSHVRVALLCLLERLLYSRRGGVGRVCRWKGKRAKEGDHGEDVVFECDGEGCQAEFGSVGWGAGRAFCDEFCEHAREVLCAGFDEASLQSKRRGVCVI